MTAALEVRRWNTIWALREVLSVGEIYSGKKRWKRKKKFEEKMKNCEKFCLLDWRGEEKLTVEIPRRRFWWPSPKFWWATPPKLSGRHSKEANENKEEEIEYDINNIMFKWPQRPRYLKLSFSDSKIREAILRRQTQFLSTETAWITLGGQKTKKSWNVQIPKSRSQSGWAANPQQSVDVQRHRECGGFVESAPPSSLPPSPPPPSSSPPSSSSSSPPSSSYQQQEHHQPDPQKCTQLIWGERVLSNLK